MHEVEVAKYRYEGSEGYLIIYLDETWFNFHDTARMVWCDKTEKCILLAPPSKGKKVVKKYAMSETLKVLPHIHFYFVGNSSLNDMPIIMMT